jgi:hypothetical protein
MCSGERLSVSLLILYAAGATISQGYCFPGNKQGIHDQRFYDSVSAAR